MICEVQNEDIPLAEGPKSRVRRGFLLFGCNKGENPVLLPSDIDVLIERVVRGPAVGIPKRVLR